VSPVKYEQGFYIPEDDILHSHRRENLKSYIALTGWTLKRRRNVSPVKYELGLYIPGDGILHSHCRENLKFSCCCDEPVVPRWRPVAVISVRFQRAQMMYLHVPQSLVTGNWP
jgi:hypothetical protein